MSYHKPQTTQTLDPLSVTENRNAEELAAFNAVASASWIDPLTRPDLVAVWTGDLSRFDATASAVVIEQTEGGERVLNASPSVERDLLENLKDLTEQVAAAPRPELLVVGSHLDYIGMTVGSNHLTGVVVLVGDPEKFNNGEELHGLTVSGSVLQQRDTDPSDAAETVERIETLYQAGMLQRAKIRILTELGLIRGGC